MTALAVRPIAEGVLAAVVGHYATDGVALPSLQYIAAGDPRLAVWECEQLTVSCGGIGLGMSPSTGTAPHQTGPHAALTNLRYTLIVVQIVRCHPLPGESGDLPDAAELHAAGLVHLDDAGRLSQALHAFAGNPAAYGITYPATVEAGAVEPVGPGGGYVAVEGTVTITVGALL